MWRPGMFQLPGQQQQEQQQQQPVMAQALPVSQHTAAFSVENVPAKIDRNEWSVSVLLCLLSTCFWVLFVVEPYCLLYQEHSVSALHGLFGLIALLNDMFLFCCSQSHCFLAFPYLHSSLLL